MTIRPVKLMSLDIDMPSDFSGHNVMEQSSVQISVAIPHNEKIKGFVFVDMEYQVQSLSDEFKFKSKIVWCFELTPRSEATNDAVFSCIQRTAEYLQDIVTSIFKNQKAALRVRQISYEECQKKIEDKVNELKA